MFQVICVNEFRSSMRRGITPTLLSPSGDHVKAYLKSYKRPDDYIYHWRLHGTGVEIAAS